MKKKISILLAGALLGASMPAYATVPEVGYSASNADIIEIKGNDLLANAKVSVAVFANDKTADDIGSEFIERPNVIHFVDTVWAEEDGSWKINWKPLVSGDYDIYVSADGVDIAQGHIDRFIISGMQTVYDVFASGTEADFKGIFADDDYYKALIGDDEVGRDKVGSSLYNLRSDNNRDIFEFIDSAKSLAALSAVGTKESLETAITTLEQAGVTFTDIDTYNNNTNSSFKTAIAEGMEGCESYTLTKLDKAFTEAVILAGIETAANWSDAKEYLDLLGNATYEENKEKVAKAVSGKAFTMSSLEDAIEDAVKKANRPSSGGSSGGGGGGAAIVLPTKTPDVVIPQEKDENQAKIFNDVENGHWAYESINMLRWKNIVCGDEKGNFYPNDKITRAETVKMLCEAFEIEIPTTFQNVYDDVTSDDWFAGYVSAAAQKGLISGTGEGTFSPRDNIIRQDIAVMIYRFAQAAGMTFDIVAEKALSDSDDISDYAKEAVQTLANAGIISGMEDGSFVPTGDATRAQAAVIISGVLANGRKVTE